MLTPVERTRLEQVARRHQLRVLARTPMVADESVVEAEMNSLRAFGPSGGLPVIEQDGVSYNGFVLQASGSKGAVAAHLSDHSVFAVSCKDTSNVDPQMRVVLPLSPQHMSAGATSALKAVDALAATGTPEGMQAAAKALRSAISVTLVLDVTSCPVLRFTKSVVPQLVQPVVTLVYACADGSFVVDQHNVIKREEGAALLNPKACVTDEALVENLCAPLGARPAPGTVLALLSPQHLPLLSDTGFVPCRLLITAGGKQYLLPSMRVIKDVVKKAPQTGKDVPAPAPSDTCAYAALLAAAAVAGASGPALAPLTPFGPPQPKARGKATASVGGRKRSRRAVEEEEEEEEEEDVLLPVLAPPLSILPPPSTASPRSVRPRSAEASDVSSAAPASPPASPIMAPPSPGVSVSPPTAMGPPKLPGAGFGLGFAQAPAQAPTQAALACGAYAWGAQNPDAALAAAGFDAEEDEGVPLYGVASFSALLQDVFSPDQTSQFEA